MLHTVVLPVSLYRVITTPDLHWTRSVVKRKIVTCLLSKRQRRKQASTLSKDDAPERQNRFLAQKKRKILGNVRVSELIDIVRKR